MTAGRVSFGASWGRVQRDDDERELFFNARSLAHPEDFSAMIKLGDDVEFEEVPDRANGTQAVHLTWTRARTLSAASGDIGAGEEE